MALENVVTSRSTQNEPELVNQPASFEITVQARKKTKARSDELVFTFKKAATNNVQVSTVELNEFIAFELSLVQEVKFVLTAFRDNHVFYVWLGIEPFEESVRTRVYDRQRAVIDAFPMFDFDFYIICATEEGAAEFASPSVHLAYKRK